MIQICACVNVVNGSEPPKINPECPIHGKPVPSKMYITPCDKCAAAEAENKRLREALLKYGAHKHTCTFLHGETRCSCGIRKIIEALAEKP